MAPIEPALDAPARLTGSAHWAFLRCPSCGSALRAAMDPNSVTLVCDGCGRTAPVRDGIPRFVHSLADPVARRTQQSFGYEWTHFGDWTASGTTNFRDYFDGVALGALRGRVVLDAGCGMGRHARQVAPHAGMLIAADFSRAVDQAARNTADLPNVCCVQADLRELPVADASVDFLYCLGVLHHLADPGDGLQRLVRKVRPGGRVRIYLYWKRHGWRGALLRLVTLARRVTTKLPHGVLRAGCWLLSVGLAALVVLPYRLLAAAGVRRIETWPLFVYTKYPFTVLYNDQFDRFSAPLEHRYDAREVEDLMRAAGLDELVVTERYGWIGDGIRPAPSPTLGTGRV